jgi:hypothetical protein
MTGVCCVGRRVAFGGSGESGATLAQLANIKLVETAANTERLELSIKIGKYLD